MTRTKKTNRTTPTRSTSKRLSPSGEVVRVLNPRHSQDVHFAASPFDDRGHLAKLQFLRKGRNTGSGPVFMTLYAIIEIKSEF